MVGKLVYPIFIMLVLTPVWHAQTKSADQMTAKTICETAGYIIKSTPGDNFKPYDITRTVSTTNGREAKLKNGCKSPPDPTLFYTACGIVPDKNTKAST